MCGPEGLKLWSTEYKDLGLCFQYLVLQIPVLTLLAIVSSYYSGRHFGHVIRGKLQKNAIRARALVAIVIAFLPVIQIYIEYTTTSVQVPPIKVLIVATQCITWIIHFIYLLTLKKRLGLSPRGPVKVCVIWTLYAVLTVISLHSYYLILYSDRYSFKDVLNFKCGIVIIVFQALYAVTLIPSEGSTEWSSYSRYITVSTVMSN